jgi:hypothetical protein
MKTEDGFPLPTPKPSPKVLADLLEVLPKIEDDGVRGKVWLAAWHFKGALERLEKRAVATLNAQTRVAAAEVAAARKIEQLRLEAAEATAAARAEAQRSIEGVAEVDLGDFDPHGWFVYQLWGDDPMTPLYVGQSQNILSRLGSHMGVSSKRAKVKRVRLTRCATKQEMAALEKRLIRKYNPPGNSAGVERRISLDQLDEPYLA